MSKVIIIFLSFMILFSCSRKEEDLKSPCVGLENSPCGPRVPLNKGLYLS